MAPLAGPVVPDLLKVMEAAAWLRVGRTSAYELAQEYLATDGASGMPTCRVGGQLRVPRQLFEEWIGIPISSWPPPELPVDDDPEPLARPVPVQPTLRPRRRSTAAADAPQLFTA